MVKTQNEAWGFYGTWGMRLGGSSRPETDKAWAKAVEGLVEVGFTEEEARKVLDSSLGRHLADQVDGGFRAVKATVLRLAAHKGWRKEMNEAARYTEAR